MKMFWFQNLRFQNRWNLNEISSSLRRGTKIEFKMQEIVKIVKLNEIKTRIKN